MLQIVERGKVEYIKPSQTLPPTTMEARQALAILAGYVATQGTLSEKRAFVMLEKYLKAQACPLQLEGA